MSPRSNPTKFTKPADEAVSRSRRSQLNIVDVARLLNKAAENNFKGLPASTYRLKGVEYVLFAVMCFRFRQGVTGSVRMPKFRNEKHVRVFLTAWGLGSRDMPESQADRYGVNLTV